MIYEYKQILPRNPMGGRQNCEKFAYEYGNQQIEQEHLFYSLLHWMTALF